MRPTATIDMTRTGSLGGVQHAMTFDPNSIAHIMSVLTDLYSDAEQAVIREYSTNAWDSHIEAGNSDPIRVTLPTALTPYFKVRDYGVGLDADDIANIYTKYGASTKRNTDDQVGMLGLGCKSALTYTQQFTVIGIKNGIKTNVSVFRIEDGTGMMEVVSETPTDEPTGVEIIIPARANNGFTQKARTFFQYWQPGTVILNEQPAVRHDGMHLDGTDIYIVDGQQQDIVVMGNVAYPVEQGLWAGNTYEYRQFHIVAYVPIGSVNFTPSREALNYTELTKKTLAGVRQIVLDKYKDQIDKDINEAATHTQAYLRYRKWEGVIRYIRGWTPTYKGQPIEFSFYKLTNVLRYDSSAYRDKLSKVNSLSMEVMERSIFILGFDKATFNPGQRAKVMKWMEDNNISKRYIILSMDMVGLPWTADFLTVDWEKDIKPIKLGTGRTYTARPKEKYDILIGAYGRTRATDDIDTKKPIYYFSPADIESDRRWGIVDHLENDAQVIILGKNRHEKFKRDFPQAKELCTYLHKRYLDAKTALTDDDKIILSKSWEKSLLEKLPIDKIDDPDLVRYASIARSTSSRVTEYIKAGAARQAAFRYGIDTFISATVFGRYPLITGGGQYDHMVVYLNAAYAAFYKENND